MESASGAPAPQPSGLGGWLVLLGIGLVVAPIRMIVELAQVHAPIFLDGTWAILTTPGTDAYHALWAPVLIFELVGNLASLVAQGFLLVFFFQCSRGFPTLYVWLALLTPAFIFADAWLGSRVLPNEPIFDGVTVQALSRSITTAVVWVPYMRVSKRVRNTFVT